MSGNKWRASRGFGSAQTFWGAISKRSFSRTSWQAMRFGDLPAWAEALSGDIHRSVIRFAGSLDIDTPDSETPLAPPLLWREPLFDQMIVNSYQPGEGITSHVDLARFEDGIAIVSLGREEVMEFQPVRAELDSAKSGLELPGAAEPSEERQSKRVKYFRETETESRADEDCRDSVGRGCERGDGSSGSSRTGPNRTADLDSELSNKAGCLHGQCSLENQEALIQMNGSEAPIAESGQAESEDDGRTSKSFAEAAERHKLSGSSKDGVRRLVLFPGSLLLMSGEARYEWKHGIPGYTKSDNPLQKSDKVRISVTLRRLHQTS